MPRKKKVWRIEVKMSLSVKLEMFEGPLDLLLHLIDKNKIDIYDIPIVEITNQYLAYVGEMEQQDLETMSDFLLMAATLLDIKAKMLLPPDEEEEQEEGADPRAELVARLVEYKLFKSKAMELRELEERGGYQVFRDREMLPKEVVSYKEPLDYDVLLQDLTLQKLQDIFHMVMKKQIEKIDPVRSRFGTIRRERVRLGDAIGRILHMCREKSQFSFQNLLEEQPDTETVVVTFLACLELIRRGRLGVTQKEIGGEILLDRLGEGELELTREELEQYD